MNTISLARRGMTAAPPTTAPPAPETDPAERRSRRLATRIERWRAMPNEHRYGVLALLLGTAALYFWGLTANGYANAFYSAAVQAGSQDWTAFLYGSSDAGNSITVDKPPAALWIMAASVRLFGLNSFAILMPEVLMGVATVGLLDATVRRYHGHAAGLLAGVVMALTPVAVLMFRFNNPDALLVLLLTAATWATLRGIETAQPKWLIWTGVLLGFGFLTKTLQAWLILPILGLLYLVAAPTTLGRRVKHSLAALAALVASAGWWVAIVELVPASARPYIGGSQTNSFLELTFGYNGLGRINGNETGSVGGGNGWGAAGIGRMFSSAVGGQISWFIPSALVLLAAGLWLRRGTPRTDTRRASYLAWGGWLLVTGLIFSFMSGIFHEYYTVALAPAIAALVGAGAADAWRRKDEMIGAFTLSVATTAASVWGFLLLTRVTAYGPLRYVVLALGMAAALGFLVIGRVHRRAVPVIVAAALTATLAGPAAYSVSTVTSAKTGSIVTAGPAGARGGPGGGGPGGAMPAPPTGATTTGTTTQRDGGGMGGLLNASSYGTEVTTALQANAANSTWAAAAIGSQNAAGLQLSSGVPVMSIGGFNGSDPSPTLAQFQQYVAQGKIHYFMSSGAGGGMGGPGGPGGGSGTSSQISAWVQANYTAVTIGGVTFYDLTQPLATS